MGTASDRDCLEEAESARFAERIDRCLEALATLPERPGFGAGPASVGGELERFPTEAQGLPLHRNEAVLADAGDPRVTVELDRFKRECNLRHTQLAGTRFSFLVRLHPGSVWRWNRPIYDPLEGGALAGMFAGHLEWTASGRPVHDGSGRLP